MTIDDFIECLHITPENAEEKIAKARHDFFGCYGWNADYDCRPSGVRLNSMPSTEDEEIKMTWDEVLDYVTNQQIRMW